MKERDTHQNDYHEFSRGQVPFEEIEAFFRINPKELPKDRPYVWYMFVQTADGIGSLSETEFADKSIGLSGPGIVLKQFKEIRSEAKGAEADWRLLQYGWNKADAVISGSGVLRAEPDLLWKPQDEDLSVEFGKQQKEPLPLRVIVTGKGFGADEMRQYPVLWPEGKGIRTLVATSEKGEDNMRKEIESLGQDAPTAEFASFGKDRVDFTLLLKTLRQKYDIQFVDLQGGPDIAGQFFRAGLVDEYRVTISPAIAGSLNSEGERRPSAVKASFQPEDLQTMSLVNTGRFGSHLFLRYRPRRIEL